jgi:hypothetical protein
MQPGHLAGLALEGEVQAAAAAAADEEAMDRRTAAAAATSEAPLLQRRRPGSPPLVLDIPPLLAEAAIASGADPSLLPEQHAEPLFGPHELRREVDYDEATGLIQAGDHHDEEERPVSVIELFFDLVFAALLSKLGAILVGELRHPTQVLFYVLIFQLIYQVLVMIVGLFENGLGGEWHW